MIKKIFFQTLLIVCYHFNDTLKHSLEVIDEKLNKQEKMEVEFIEKLYDEPYLQYISYDDQYFLDLYRFSQELENPNNNFQSEDQVKCP